MCRCCCCVSFVHVSHVIRISFSLLKLTRITMVDIMIFRAADVVPK